MNLKVITLCEEEHVDNDCISQIPFKVIRKDPFYSDRKCVVNEKKRGSGGERQSKDGRRHFQDGNCVRKF